MNLIKRLQGETPKFFKRIIAISMTLSVAAGALLTAPMVVSGFVIPDMLYKFAQWCLVGGVVATAVSKTTISTPTTEYKAPKDEETQNK